MTELIPRGQDRLLPRLTEADLKRFAQDCRAAIGGNPKLWAEVMAHETIIHFMGTNPALGAPGPRWIMANVFGYGRGLSDTYLRHDWADGGGRRRTIGLAEILYHLQDVPGIERLVTALRGDTIESPIAELEAAKLLYMAGLRFHFVTPSGVKGSDFDAIVAIPGSSSINCELKCKIEDTKLSTATIVTTLKASSTQLPKGEPNATLVKLPDTWMQEPTLIATIHDAVAEYFRHSQRVAAVVFHGHIHALLENGLTLDVIWHQSESNPASEFRDFVKSEIVDRLPRLQYRAQPWHSTSRGAVGWRYLDQIGHELGD